MAGPVRDPETHGAADPPAPGHEGGFRAAGRVAPGRADRIRVWGAVVAAAAVVATGLGLAALAPAPSVRDGATPGATSSPRSGPLATGLPQLAVLGRPGASGSLPIIAAGLRWLDTATGHLAGGASRPTSGTPLEGARFITTDGRVACLCVSATGAGTTTFRVELTTWDADGRVTGTVTIETRTASAVPDLPPDDRFQLDAALALDGRQAWLATAVREEASWVVSIERIALPSGRIEASTQLPPISAAASGAAAPDELAFQPGTIVRPHVRVSPGSTRLSVAVDRQPVTGIGPTIAIDSAGALGIAARRFELRAQFATGEAATSVPSPAAPITSCAADLSGWANDAQFVGACSSTDGTSVQLLLRVESPGGIARDIPAGPAIPRSAAGGLAFLLDAANGAVIVWAPERHMLSRLTVASGTVGTVVVDPSGAGLPGSLPAATTGIPAAWVPMTDATESSSSTLIGSPGGRVIYALGWDLQLGFSGDPPVGPRSTGIWAFAADGSALARFAPLAAYGELDIAPDGSLVALSAPGVTADGSASGWPPAIWYLDPADGHGRAVYGGFLDVAGTLADLTTPNAPFGVAGL